MSGQAKTLSLPAELDNVELLAKREGFGRAAMWIADERGKRWPISDWELGECLVCRVELDKRRKATMFDGGSGTPVCDDHAPGCPDPPFLLGWAPCGCLVAALNRRMASEAEEQSFRSRHRLLRVEERPEGHWPRWAWITDCPHITSKESA